MFLNFKYTATESSFSILTLLKWYRLETFWLGILRDFIHWTALNIFMIRCFTAGVGGAHRHAQPQPFQRSMTATCFQSINTSKVSLINIFSFTLLLSFQLSLLIYVPSACLLFHTGWKTVLSSSTQESVLLMAV